MKVFLCSTLLLASVFSHNVYAQDDLQNDSLITEEQEEEKWGIGAHPVIGYDSKSSLTIGVGAVIYFEPDDKNQDLDEISLLTSYNLKKQYDIMIEYSKYFKDNICSIDGQFGFQNYPDDFEGDDYDAVYLPFEIGSSIKVLEKLYIGPIYKLNYSNIHFKNHNAELLHKNLLGTGRMHSSGFGGQITLKNTTKGQLYRREGNIFKISGVYYSPVFLSSSEFTEIEADYRHYFPVLKQCVFAFQIVGKTSLGNVPFYDIPDLESKGLLRGGSSMSGKYFLAGQTEFRFPILWRIGSALFIGAGEVENRMNRFGKDIGIAGGVGLRITLNKAKNINLRFDMAYNEKREKSIYIKIMEAF